MNVNDDQELTITAEDGAIVIRMHPLEAGFLQNAFRTHAVAHGDDEVIVEGAFEWIDGINDVFAQIRWDTVKCKQI